MRKKKKPSQPFVVRQPQFISPPPQININSVQNVHVRPRNRGGYSFGFNQPMNGNGWNNMGGFGGSEIVAPPLPIFSGGNQNQILSDEMLARKLQAEENRKSGNQRRQGRYNQPTQKSTWNPLNVFGGGSAVPPPMMGNNNTKLTDEQLARKLQAEENSKAYTNRFIPRRFLFKQPRYFERGRRKREISHVHDRSIHRDTFKESSNRRKIERERNMEYRKKKFINVARRRQYFWNQRRKMNNHSSKMALSRFPVVRREIGGKRLSIDELLEGCYYTPGYIRGMKNQFQHKLDFTFPNELPVRQSNNIFSQDESMMLPPPPPNFNNNSNNNNNNSGFNNEFSPGPPPPPILSEVGDMDMSGGGGRKKMIEELPESFSDEEEERGFWGGYSNNNNNRSSTSMMEEEEEEEPAPLPLPEEEVEICFVIDCTGSMVNILDQMKRDIESIIAQLLKDIPGVRFSFVVFGDYSDFRMYYLVKKLDFSNDPRHIKKFLDDINGTGGGTNPEEAYGLALLEARALSWGRAKNKFALLIGDSVPYEVDKDPLGIDWRKVVHNKTITPLNFTGSRVRVIPIQCLTNDPKVSRFYQEVGENRVLMRNFEILTVFEVFLAICYQGKHEEELDELVKNFEGLSIDNVKKFHFKLNQNPFGNN